MARARDFNIKPGDREMARARESQAWREHAILVPQLRAKEVRQLDRLGDGMTTGGGLERAAAPESVARAPHAFPLARPPRGANLRDLAFTFTLARAVWKSVLTCVTLTNIHAHG